MTLLDVLMWVLPSGFLASVVTWLVSRSTFNARNHKEQEVIYKELYESQGKTLLQMQDNYSELQNSNLEINENLSKMYRLLQRIPNTVKLCRYYDSCPVVPLLQKCQTGRTNSTALGKTQSERYGTNNLREGPDEEDTAGAISGSPP